MHDLNRMVALQLEGRHDEARAISDYLESLGPDIWQRHCFNRGWFMIRDGNFQLGSQLLEHGRFISAYGSSRLATTAPVFNPQQHDIRGARLIIALEGGLGDEIICARFATSYMRLGAASVTLAAQASLTSVLARVAGVSRVITRSDVHGVPHDYWLPGFSAGWVAGHTFDSFPSGPYLSARHDLVEAWRGVIRRGPLRVGIRWSGSPDFEHQQHRRFPVEPLLALSELDGAQLYSLQRDNDLRDLPDAIVDLAPRLVDWEATAAAIANLDLVISSCTSVAHLAAAMGKETWVIVPILPYHTWAPGAPESRTTPYYDSVRLFRQRVAGSWREPLDDVRAMLEQRLRRDHAA